MSNLPSYLEEGKATPDRALSFGVMDWGRLEKCRNVAASETHAKISSLSSKHSNLDVGTN
ncbi:hypothetical protein CTI12_AA341830 [Artemisia annua]|uniref:Uncharacterized protein n=1 Tax=Artemisia annua TaxID=35608 RepID=A0A2U1MTD5_ARTAN|nr:hypothetical protein CTI12_AA341830 [Artemisia annua]